MKAVIVGGAMLDLMRVRHGACGNFTRFMPT
jgi:hypothetical protein